MTVLLASDGFISIQIESLATHLNSVCKHVRFEAHKTPINLGVGPIAFPQTYIDISKVTTPLLKKHSAIFIATGLPYDNNYFWESDSAVMIFSFWGWPALTNLSMNNGMVNMISSALAQELDHKAPRHEEITGCVNDFMWDKRGIDSRMRAGILCRECYERVSKHALRNPTTPIKKFGCTASDGLSDLVTLLDEVAQASKREIDIVTRWQARAGVTQEFDVFLCHNSEDKESVRKLYKGLKKRSIKPWFDEEHLRPGTPWQSELERTISSISSAAVVVGPHGQGPWQKVELRSFLQAFIDRGCSVIPVLLGDAGATPELPIFLSQFSWVDFRKTKPDPWQSLLWGITGQKRTR